MTSCEIKGISLGMHTRLAIILFCPILGSGGLAQEAAVAEAEVLERRIEREAVPAEVLAAAVDAVQEVGDQTLRGEYEAVVEKMYPRFRKRAAKKLGGNDQLVTQMRKLVNEYAASGIAITKFQAEPAIHGFDIPEFKEWLVFVPTTRTVRFIDPQTGLKEVKEVSDYQVAVRSKVEGETWSFLNGSTMQIPELLALFPSLPRDIKEWAVPLKKARDVR